MSDWKEVGRKRRRGREITGVSTSTLFDLRAALYAKEEEVRTGRRALRQTRQRRTITVVDDEVRNRGVQVRAKRDEDKPTPQNSKADIYRELTHQARRRWDSSEGDCALDGWDDDECVVDFNRKEQETREDPLEETLEWAVPNEHAPLVPYNSNLDCQPLENLETERLKHNAYLKEQVAELRKRTVAATVDLGPQLGRLSPEDCKVLASMRDMI
mmetsp:Transcript_13940/g.28551  ORF Transcript_13940/g.28551 Transcript_13940/m.28551 type:complete len:214 (+) Transcript_13940:109-750(+)